jgi:hypothetical protein
MPVRDHDVYNEIQSALVEPRDGGASWPSACWTVDEVVNYATQRQNRFLRDSGALIGRANLVTTPNNQLQPLPTDWLATRRAVWKGSDGVITVVPKLDSFELDHGLESWTDTSAVLPVGYTDTETPHLQIRLGPAPTDAGTLEILYVYVGTVLGVTGELLTVPDDCSAAIKYGTMADMLGKVGRMHDPARAQYCEQRFQEYVAVVQLLIGGWT